jgi:hypothetical protein
MLSCVAAIALPALVLGHGHITIPPARNNGTVAKAGNCESCLSPLPHAVAHAHSLFLLTTSICKTPPYLKDPDTPLSPCDPLPLQFPTFNGSPCCTVTIVLSVRLTSGSSVTDCSDPRTITHSPTQHHTLSLDDNCTHISRFSHVDSVWSGGTGSLVGTGHPCLQDTRTHTHTHTHTHTRTHTRARAHNTPLCAWHYYFT